MAVTARDTSLPDADRRTLRGLVDGAQRVGREVPLRWFEPGDAKCGPMRKGSVIFVGADDLRCRRSAPLAFGGLLARENESYCSHDPLRRRRRGRDDDCPRA
jgi:hypothetical protein